MLDFPGLSVGVACRDGLPEYSEVTEHYPGQRAISTSHWYKETLARLREAPLPCIDSATHSYRLIEKLPFGDRLLVIGIAKTATSARLWSVLSDQKDNRIISRAARMLTDEEWKLLEDGVAAIEYWTEPSQLPPTPSRRDADDGGGRRMVEGFREKRYHVVVRGLENEQLQQFRQILVRMSRLTLE